MERERGEERANVGGGALLRLIEKATDSTDREVDPRLLKAIKSAVRSSDGEVQIAVDALMDKMKKQHSQVRYLAILIIDELFMRSKFFRCLLVVNFDHFLSLSVGFRRNMPLPPPSIIASILRSKSIELLEKWNALFGIHYRQLRLGCDYLKNTLRFQFPNRLENAARLQQERSERETRSKEILLNKFENFKENYSTIKGEIQSTLDQLGECLEIVQVKEDEFIYRSSLEDEESEEFTCSILRQIRLDSLKEGEKVHESSENKAVFDALRELYKLLVSKHLLSVQEWISVLVRVDLADNKFRDSALKEWIDIRNIIQSVKKRCEELGCVLPDTTVREQEENMWEEGKIEVYEHKNGSAPSMSIDKSVDTSISSKNKDKVPSARDVSLNGDGSGSMSPRSRLLSEAPVLQWSSFLDSWGSSQDALANQRGLELESHWGRVDHDAVIPAEKIAELNLHRSIYKEKTVEIQPCLAPLKKGGLCQRRDLRVCPFHGPIVPRDSKGYPMEEHLLDANGSPIVKDHLDAKGNPIVKNLDVIEGNTIKENLSRGETAKESSKQGTESLDEERARLHDSDKPLVKQLARQAVENVRERDREVRSLKRAKLAKVRQHNEAVLREAALASTSHSGAFAGDMAVSHEILPEAKVKKQTLASMLRKKVTTKDRLAQRLLNTRVTDAAIRQLMQGDDAAYKEAYPNQW